MKNYRTGLGACANQDTDEVIYCAWSARTIAGSRRDPPNPNGVRCRRSWLVTLGGLGWSGLSCEVEVATHPPSAPAQNWQRDSGVPQATGSGHVRPHTSCAALCGRQGTAALIGCRTARMLLDPLPRCLRLGRVVAVPPACLARRSRPSGVRCPCSSRHVPGSTRSAWQAAGRADHRACAVLRIETHRIASQIRIALGA